MAADLRLTAELEAKGVVMGANKARDAINGLKKPTADVGRGFLAVSQATEDFAMAGMKGVLNNIPQAIGAFGGSAGLAAGASFAAVAIYVLTDKIFGLLDAMQEAKLADFAKATFIDVSGFESRKKATDEARKSMELYTAASKNSMSKEMSGAELNASNYSTLSESSRRLSLETEILAIKQSSLSETQKEAEIKQRSYQAEIAAMDEKVALSQYVANFASQDSEARANAVKSTKDALVAEKAKLLAIEEQLKVGTNLTFQKGKSEREGLNSAFRQGEGKAFYMDANGEWKYGKQSWSEERARIVDAKNQNAIDNIAKINELRNAAKPQIEMSNTQIGQLEEQLKAMEEVGKLSDEERIKKTSALEILRAETEQNKQTLKIKQGIATQDERANREQEVRNAAKAMMSNDAISSSGLLSGLGRVGGSAREAVSALGAINIQKQQLSTLKTIARNTAKRTVATAG